MLSPNAQRELSTLFVRCMSQQLCRFLDAGNDEMLLARRRPASKKRQGTKSREVSHRLSNERYGNLVLTPAVMVGAILAQGDLEGCARRLEESNGPLGSRVDGINGRSAR
jgi:hypothetical protein